MEDDGGGKRGSMGYSVKCQTKVMVYYNVNGCWRSSQAGGKCLGFGYKHKTLQLVFKMGLVASLQQDIVESL